MGVTQGQRALSGVCGLFRSGNPWVTLGSLFIIRVVPESLFLASVDSRQQVAHALAHSRTCSSSCAPRCSRARRVATFLPRACSFCTRSHSNSGDQSSEPGSNL